MNRVARALPTALGVALLTACPEEPPDQTFEEPILHFDTTIVRVATPADTHRVMVELALSPEQRGLGLMERRQLPDSMGMLFVYDSTQPPTATFWMFRTRIPLDIAFIDTTGVIRAINAMEPCAVEFARACPNYPATVPFRMALEVNRGYFARRGIQVGSRVLLDSMAR